MWGRVQAGFTEEGTFKLGRVGASIDESGALQTEARAFGPCLPACQDPADSIPWPTPGPPDLHTEAAPHRGASIGLD